MPARLLTRPLLAVAGAAALAAFTPASAHAARSCPDYIDFFDVRAYDRASSKTVRGVQRALYRLGFNAEEGSTQLVEYRGKAWRCRWRSGATAPKTRCRNLEGRGSFRARLNVG
jgi:hypothetical protein